MAFIAGDITHKETDYNTTDLDSYITGSVSYTADRLYVLCIGGRNSVGVNAIPDTVTTSNITWTSQESLPSDVVTLGITLYTGVPSLSSSQTTQIDFPTAQEGCQWSIFEINNANTSSPKVQSTSEVQTGTSYSLTLGAITTGNIAISCFSTDGFRAFTAGTNEVEIAQDGYIHSQYNLAEDATLDCTINSSITGIGVAIEIAFSSDVEADFISSGNNLYEPAVKLDQTLSADYISTGNNLYEPSVELEGGLSVDYISTGNNLYEPTLLQSEQANSWRNAVWFKSPTYGSGWWGEVTVATADFIDNTTQLYNPTLGGSITTDIDFISNVEALYEPTLSLDDVIACPHISSTAQLYEPGVSAFQQTLSLDYIGSSNQLYEPSVNSDRSFTIDGAASLVISTNYQSKTLYCGGANGWFTID